MSILKCQFPGCSWRGDVSRLYAHCDKEHHEFVIEMQYDKYFSLEFDKIDSNTYLLCGKEGLYWFCVNKNLHQKDRLERGIFAIDDSEICEYKILIGSKAKGVMASQGPFMTRPSDSGQCDIQWTARQLMCYHQMELQSLTIIFSQPGQWARADNSMDKTMEVAKRSLYKCSLCHKYMNAKGSICIRRHCLCEKCGEDASQWFGDETCSLCAAECENEMHDDGDGDEENEDGYQCQGMERAVKLRCAIKIKAVVF